MQAWLPRNTVFVNKDAFDGLSEANRAALMDCGAKAAAAGEARARELTSHYLKVLAENGMAVQGPTDALKEGLQGYGATMTEEWIASAGAAGKAVVDAYRTK